VCATMCIVRFAWFFPGRANNARGPHPISVTITSSFVVGAKGSAWGSSSRNSPQVMSSAALDPASHWRTWAWVRCLLYAGNPRENPRREPDGTAVNSSHDTVPCR
jgi:hypothetical protein